MDKDRKKYIDEEMEVAILDGLRHIDNEEYLKAYDQATALGDYLLESTVKSITVTVDTETFTIDTINKDVLYVIFGALDCIRSLKDDLEEEW